MFMNLLILCSIEVHSLKETGKEIFVRSFPTEDLRMLHTADQLRIFQSLTADGWPLVIVDRQLVPDVGVRLKTPSRQKILDRSPL